MIERMANGDPTWGYQRIQGELRKVGVRVSASTIRRVLNRLGVPPAPRRQQTCLAAVPAHPVGCQNCAEGAELLVCVVGEPGL